MRNSIVLFILIFCFCGISLGKSRELSYRQDLVNKFQNDPEKLRAAQEVYDSPVIIDKFPEACVRAALANLAADRLGAIALPYIVKDVSKIIFDWRLCKIHRIAEMNPNTGKISICPLYKNGPVEFLGAIILHEVIHRYLLAIDGCEEYIAEWFDSYYSAKEVVDQPSLIANYRSNHLKRTMFIELRDFAFYHLRNRCACLITSDALAPLLVQELIHGLAGKDIATRTLQECANFLYHFPGDTQLRCQLIDIMK